VKDLLLFFEDKYCKKSDIFKLFSNKRFKEIAVKYFQQTFKREVHDLCRLIRVMIKAKTQRTRDNERKAKK